MRYFLLLLISLLSINRKCLAQKNIISVEHSTILSKLQFEEKIDDFYTRNRGPVSSLYWKTKMNRPIITTSTRFSYQRKVTDKISVGTWGRKLTRGLKSEYSFDIVNIQDTAVLSDSYGGFNLIYRLRSFEIGLSLDYHFFSNQAITYIVGIKPAFDIYSSLEIKGNVLNRMKGTVFFAERSIEHFHSEREIFLDRYKDHIEYELYRMSLYFTGIIEYKTVIKGLFLKCSLEVGGSTPLKTKDPAPLSFLPDGWILLGSVQFGLSYHF